MDTLFDIIKTVLLGFGALLLALFVLAVLFGKRVRKQWEYEAEFRDANGREFGEFEVELSQIEKEEPQPTAKLKLKLEDPALTVGKLAVVKLNDQVVYEVPVESDGRVSGTAIRPAAEVSRPAEGDLCQVLAGGAVIAEAKLKLD